MQFKTIFESQRNLKLTISPAALRFSGKEGIGTVIDETNFVQALTDNSIPVSKISILPINQNTDNIASPFSAGAFGLNPDYISLELIPELNNVQLNYPAFSSEEFIDFKQVRAYKYAELAKAAEIFYRHIAGHNALQTERAADFQAFLMSADINNIPGISYNWVENNANFYLVQQELLRRGYAPDSDFRTWPKEFQRPDTPEVSALVNSEQARDFKKTYRYIQFVVHEQQTKVNELYKKSVIKREVNLPYGVDPRASGDVWMLQGIVFDLSYNVGCYPEPENGYPEQNWGMPQYIEGPAFEEFIKVRYKYLARYVQAIFIDHLCGFTNKYYAKVGGISGSKDGKIPPSGFFYYPLHPTDLTNRGDVPLPKEYENPDYQNKVRETLAENVYKMLKIILALGLEVDGETVGDPDRQWAVETAIKKLNEEKYQIPLMYILMYKDLEGNFELVQKLLHLYELFSGTHDTPTITQMLCNERGQDTLWFSAKKIANFLSQALGILATPNQTPLQTKELTREFGISILERLSSASAGTVTLTLQDIFALLFPEKYGTSKKLTLNQPGSSSTIGNPDNNFSVRFPSANIIFRNKKLIRLLQEIALRPTTAIDQAFALDPVSGYDFYTQAAAGANSQEIVFKNPKTNKWEVKTFAEKILLKIAIGNLEPNEQAGMVKLPDSLRAIIDHSGKYTLVDLANLGATGDYVTYPARQGSELLDGLYIKLAGKQNHYFIVYPENP